MTFTDTQYQTTTSNINETMKSKGRLIYETLWDAIGILQAFNISYRILGILVALTLNASNCDSTHTSTMYMFMYKQRYTDEKK